MNMRARPVLTFAACGLLGGSLGCGMEQGMYEGSQISAIIMLSALYVFSLVCILGSLLKRWSMAPLFAGLFVLICCTVILLMTPYLWLGIVLLIAGLIAGYLAFRGLRREGPSS